MKYRSSPGRKKLRGWLDTHSVNVETLAEFIGVSKSLISQWLSGASRPAWIDRIALEALCYIDQDDWLTEFERERIKRIRIEISRTRSAKPVRELTARERLLGRI